MPCYVLRCDQPSTTMATLSDLGIGDNEIRHEVLLCAEHHYKITDGERCAWDDKDMVLLVGEDLDSGGHLVMTGEWTIESRFGRDEVVLDIETPSGKPVEPVKFLITRADRQKWLDFLHGLGDAQPPAEEAPTA